MRSAGTTPAAQSTNLVRNSSSLIGLSGEPLNAWVAVRSRLPSTNVASSAALSIPSAGSATNLTQSRTARTCRSARTSASNSRVVKRPRHQAAATQKLPSKRACWSSAGTANRLRLLRVTSAASGATRKLSEASWARLSGGVRRRSSRVQSRGAWLMVSVGYRLKATGLSSRQPSPSESRIAATRAGSCSATLASSPCSPSMAVAGAVKPAHASNAATSPLRAASPMRYGWTSLPRTSSGPAPPSAASPSAWEVRSLSSPSTSEQPAAAPTAPAATAGLKPRS